MYRKDKKTLPADVVTPQLGMGEKNSLLPTPSVTRRSNSHFRRRTKGRYLLRSGFVLLSMALSFLFLSPRSPLYANVQDNQSPHEGILNRKLLAAETTEEGSGATEEPTNE